MPPQPAAPGAGHPAKRDKKKPFQMPASDLKIETRIGVKSKPRRILSIVSNTTELNGFPVGFFAEEMTRAFLMFTEAGHQVDLASPKGGEVMFDTHSDPRTPGGAYVDDLISLGFVHHAKFGAMLKNTLPISAANVEDYDAVWVAGGGGPLLTFKDDIALHDLIASFYEKGKIVALICHGSGLLRWTHLSDGKLLADGKKWTGFTDEEEEEVNAAFGMTLNEYTIRARRPEWREPASFAAAPTNRSPFVTDVSSPASSSTAARLRRNSCWRHSTNIDDYTSGELVSAPGSAPFTHLATSDSVLMGRCYIDSRRQGGPNA
jgi:putative intracellular protease/amidase